MMVFENDDKAILLEFYLNEGKLSFTTEDEHTDRVNRLMHYVRAMSGIEIWGLLKEHRSEFCDITTKNIPQFSDIQSIDKVLNIVESSVDGKLAYRNIGYFFNKDASEGAQHKYGENHYKLASSIGLVTVEKPYSVTPLYYAYLLSERTQKKEIIAKLLLNIPIIQKILIESEKSSYNVPDLLYQYLSKSTARRRGSSIKQVINSICDIMPETERAIIKNNIEWRYE